MAWTMRGKYLWIWELDQTLGGDIAAIATLGRQLGLAGFIIKSHDGETVWQQFEVACKPLQAAGFEVFAWGYVYGTDPEQEALAALPGIEAGATAYIIDAETSFEGQPEAATLLGATLRAHSPELPIGYAPFAFPADHPTFPYAEFSAFCDVCMPQLYWAEFAMPPDVALAQSQAQLAAYALPLAPIGQAYGTATAQQITQFAAAVKASHESVVSFWDVQSANSQQLQAIASISGFPAPVPTAVKTSATKTGTADHGGIAPTGTAHAGGSARTRSATTLKMPDDVQSNDWFYGAVRDLLEDDVVTAYQDGLFKPDEPITRAQAADWLNRLRILLQDHRRP